MKKALVIASAVMTILFTIGLFTPLTINADGKFFPTDKIPPNIPYQRAIISYADGEELLILQSKFEGEAKDFGWVIPVPNPPKLGNMEPGHAEFLFRILASSTHPNYVETIPTIIILLFLASTILLIIRVIIYAINRKPIHILLKILGLIVATMWIILLVVIPVLQGRTPKETALSKGVDIISAQQVGIYDVKVIKSSDSGELIKWLNEHQYKFDQKDEKAFSSYIQKGWCFVTARITNEEIKDQKFRFYGKLVNPLVLMFPTKEMVYPLTLTSTIGSETEILIYVFGNNKVSANNRLTLEFAGELKLSYLSESKNIESQDGLDVTRFTGKYVTKFKERLTSIQMTEDLIITKAPDNQPYRRTIWR